MRSVLSVWKVVVVAALGSFLAQLDATVSVSNAFTVSFALLCGLHALLNLAAANLPIREHGRGFDYFKLSEIEL
jgi:hypothetical protein